MEISDRKNPDGSLEVTVGEKVLSCVVCGNNSFHERTSLLNSRSGELFGLAWADSSATNYICTTCGYVFWFSA
jgi:hypothetical protein